MKQAKLLVLGGANFIGRNLLQALATIDAFEVTLFNRGKTNPELFPQFKRLIGDRNTTDIQKIGQEAWDYVIDLSCYYPHALRATLSVLNRSNLKRYVFISTCSVYDLTGKAQDHLTTEDDLLLTCSQEEAESPLPAAYGNKKVACEQLLEADGLDFISLRPGLVYGAHDYTDRFYYWLYQAYRKGPILLPNNGVDELSLTYVQDLVAVMLESLLANLPKRIYNVMSLERVSIRQILNDCDHLLGHDLHLVHASTDFLENAAVKPWSHLPLWVPNQAFCFSNATLKTDFEYTLKTWEASLMACIQHYEARDWYVPTAGLSPSKQDFLIQQLL